MPSSIWTCAGISLSRTLWMQSPLCCKNWPCSVGCFLVFNTQCDIFPLYPVTHIFENLWGIFLAVTSSVSCNCKLLWRASCKCAWSAGQESWIFILEGFLLVNDGKHLTFGPICYVSILIPSEWTCSVLCTVICRNYRNNHESKILV